MDAVVSAVLSALGVMGSTSLSEAIKKATADAYDVVKRTLKRSPENAGVVNAIDLLEADRMSPARAALLQEEVKKSKLFEDPTVQEALRHLAEALALANGGSEAGAMTATGSIIAQANNRSVAQVILGGAGTSN